jgi:hypothetical protein
MPRRKKNQNSYQNVHNAHAVPQNNNNNNKKIASDTRRAIDNKSHNIPQSALDKKIHIHDHHHYHHNHTNSVFNNIPVCSIQWGASSLHPLEQLVKLGEQDRFFFQYRPPTKFSSYHSKKSRRCKN